MPSPGTDLTFSSLLAFLVSFGRYIWLAGWLTWLAGRLAGLAWLAAAFHASLGGEGTLGY